MNQSNERNNFGGNVEESGNNQAGSNANQGASDFGEAAGTFNGAVTGAMIGAPFGLFGTVIGGVSGGAIGNQIVRISTLLCIQGYVLCHCKSFLCLWDKDDSCLTALNVRCILNNATVSQPIWV
jgi:uncharacterized protein YcfJ